MTSSTLDLHGMTREQALAELDIHLNRWFVAGVLEARVVTGSGRGVLVGACLDVLHFHELVEDFHPETGGYRVRLACSEPREDDALPLARVQQVRRAMR